MDLNIILNAITCLFAFSGAVFGIVCLFKKRRPLYFIMIVASVGITAFCRLYDVVWMWSSGESFSGFHIGILGTIGTFLFLFTANYGEMDSLCDDKTPRLKKYRLLSFFAPAAVALFYVPLIFSDISVELKISYALITVIVMLASYYNLKHLIIPDVDFGVIKCIRGYNFLMLLNALFSMAELSGTSFGIAPLQYVSTVSIGIISLITIPVLKRGAEKWVI